MAAARNASGQFVKGKGKGKGKRKGGRRAAAAASGARGKHVPILPVLAGAAGLLILTEPLWDAAQQAAKGNLMSAAKSARKGIDESLRPERIILAVTPIATAMVASKVKTVLGGRERKTAGFTIIS